MSVSTVTRVLEKCKVGHSLKGGVLAWLETQQREQQRPPLLLRGAGAHELPFLSKELHSATQQLFGLDGAFTQQSANELYCAMQTYGEQPLHTWRDGTVLLTQLEELSEDKQIALLQALQQAELIKKHELFLLVGCHESLSLTIQETLGQLCPYQLTIPPLYQRHTDIDRHICRLTQRLLGVLELDEINGFSLEATAHIHRAIIQTQRNTDELFAFLETLFARTKDGALPLHNGYIVTWPTVRLLEDTWGYRINGSHTQSDEIAECDFQERLFSASIEHASLRSGFSKRLVELQCQLLQQMINELPPHQQNYQGLTARMDQLQWIGMKLLSNARTQAELRDYFGFGSKGKIPKATAKLKFDQYDLGHYGYRVTDPIPWQANTVTPLPTASRVTPPTEPILQETHIPTTRPTASAPRHIVEVTGELQETLYWRHQDLFTVLAADALDTKQIAEIVGLPTKRLQQDLDELVAYNFLVKEGKTYALNGDDVYYRHSHSRLRCIEENLLRYLQASLDNQQHNVLENWFLRLPEEGLPALRETLIKPFIHEQFLPLSDNDPLPEDGSYNKRMYALMLLGTHRLSTQIHGRLPMEQRILYYFREASLQRATRTQKDQAICLRATQMLTPDAFTVASQHIDALRKELRSYLPHGRGNKPNFNLTLCFTEVPLSFYRDQSDEPDESWYKELFKTK